MSINGGAGDISLSTNNCTGSLTPSSSCTFNITIAPEYEDIGTLAAQTISVDYGGTSPLTTTIGPITVTNPALIAVGTDGSSQAITYASTDLGQTWSNITSKVGYSSASDNPSNAAGGAIANGGGQLLNDTLLIAVAVPDGEGRYLNNASSTIRTANWSNSSVNIGSSSFSTTYTFGTNALGYGNLNGNPTFFAGPQTQFGAPGHVTDYQSLFAYSLNGSSITKTSQALSSSYPSAVGFGGGYYIMAISGTGNIGGHTRSAVYYTTDPTGTWLATPPNAAWDFTTVLSGIAYARLGSIDRWVVAGDTSISYTTFNAINLGWSQATGTFSATLKGVVYDNLLAKFVAVDQAGNYYTSSLGTGWANQGSMGDSDVAAMTYSHSTGTIVVVGNSGQIHYTTGTSINWQAATGITGTAHFSSVASSTST